MPIHDALKRLIIEYDEETGLVHFVDDLTVEAEAAFYSGDGEEPVVVYGQALLPRGPGFFAVAGTFGGEVSAVNPQFAPIVEFEFDPDSLNMGGEKPEQ